MSCMVQMALQRHLVLVNHQMILTGGTESVRISSLVCASLACLGCLTCHYWGPQTFVVQNGLEKHSSHLL